MPPQDVSEDEAIFILSFFKISSKKGVANATPFKTITKNKSLKTFII
jgi:hypothetical protein